jgi:GT2 family glycosyltransferase
MPGQQSEGVSRPCVCIANYNGQAYLPRTLGRLLELRDQFDRILLVDDGSTDGSAEVARRILGAEGVLVLPANAGPAGARNAGFAALAPCRRVLFVDNDVFLGVDTARRLTEALDSAPRAVLALPRVVSDEDPDNIEFEGGEAHFSGLLTLRGAGERRSERAAGPPVPVGSVVGSCLLIDRERWGNVPPFDPLFRMYFEDLEIGLRARILGHEVLAVPEAECRHGKGTPGMSIRATGRYTVPRVRHSILGRWQVLLKLYQGRTLILLAPFLLAFEAAQLLGCMVLGWGGHWLWSARELLRNAPVILEQRRAVGAARVRPDAAVLDAGPLPLNPALLRRWWVRVGATILDGFANLNWKIAAAAGGTKVT